MNHHQTWLRFTYVFIIFRSHYHPPHPCVRETTTATKSDLVRARCVPVVGAFMTTALALLQTCTAGCRETTNALAAKVSDAPPVFLFLLAIYLNTASRNHTESGAHGRRRCVRHGC
jgi:hypothetical protein